MTLVFPSMLVLSTRKMCWKLGGHTSAIFSAIICTLFIRWMDQTETVQVAAQDGCWMRVCKSVHRRLNHQETMDVEGGEGRMRRLLVLLGAHLGAGVRHPDGQLLGSLHQGLPMKHEAKKCQMKINKIQGEVQLSRISIIRRISERLRCKTISEDKMNNEV